MTAPLIHYEIEILYETTFRNACGSRAAVNVTTRDEDVTCPACLRALGYEPVPADQLTGCTGDPLLRAA